MAKLIWKRRDGDAKTFFVGEGAVIGRDANLECVLDVKSVSRRHARIDRLGSSLAITDLGSTNGTVVNGVRIEAATRIGSGDRIRLGDEVLEVMVEPDTLPATGPMTKESLETAPMQRSPRQGAGAAAAADRDPRTEEALPKRHGKFYLLKRLGQGGMGTVYHALDLDSNREVAVKFIRSNIGRNEAFLDFFHNREAVLAREIDHSNVIRIYEHGVDADHHFISMEYVVGKNLYSVLKERRFEPSQVLEILKQMACGLVAAHRQGVVHSDIKPANVLLAGDGEPAPQAGSTRPEAAGGDSSDPILEFDTEVTLPPRPVTASAKYDQGLIDEIRRRVGEPSNDLFIDPPYFPRQSEMSFLTHYLERINEGKGFFVLVEGEAGTGKKRLVSELMGPIKARGTRPAADAPAPRYLELDCSRIEGIPQLYEQVFGINPASTLGLLQVAEEIIKGVASEPRSIVLRLLGLGTAIPVACELLAALAPHLGSHGILVVGTLAPGEERANGSLKQLLERLSEHTKELYLRPLTEYQIQRYLQLIFRDALTGFDLAGHMYRLSRGNFAKLLEMLRSFFERGVLTLDKPSGRLIYRPRQQELELEEGKGLYEKYRSYGKIEQHVLEMAAFIGPRFLFDTLIKLHDINETSLFFVVRTLLAEGFFVEDGRTWYAFTNVAFQRYMAERIPEQERPHMHRRLSRLLQTVPVPDSAELQQLRARHFTGCHEYAKAVQALLDGAHLARCDYRADLAREMMQEILRVYRLLARRDSVRKEVTGVLRDWFHRDGNWYEILGELSSAPLAPRVKIADFGISFRLKDEERGYQLEKRPVLGTPRYMAPERANGDYGGFKSDVFSLGVITYEMAVGSPPFPELKGNDVVQANRELKITLPAEILKRYPPGMEALFNGMIDKDPRRRWDAERVVREVAKLQLDAATR